MKILIAGTFCSGKTTLANQLHDHLEGVSLVPDICREVLDSFPTVDWSALELRDYLIVRQLLVEKKTSLSERVTVIDSGIISNLAHDRVLLPKPCDRTGLIEHLGHDRYDLVFHCDYRDIGLIEDGQRFTDANLQKQIDREIVNVLQMHQYGDPILVSGSKEDRLIKASNLILQLIGT